MKSVVKEQMSKNFRVMDGIIMGYFRVDDFSSQLLLSKSAKSLIISSTFGLKTRIIHHFSGGILMMEKFLYLVA